MTNYQVGQHVIAVGANNKPFLGIIIKIADYWDSYNKCTIPNIITVSDDVQIIRTTAEHIRPLMPLTELDLKTHGHFWWCDDEVVYVYLTGAGLVYNVFLSLSDYGVTPNAKWRGPCGAIPY